VLPLTVIDPPVLQSLSFSSTTTDIEPGFTQTLAPIAGYSDGTTVTVSDAQWAIISGDADSFELDSATGEITANPDITLEQSIVLQATFENLTAEIEIVSTGDTSEVIVDTQLYYVDQSGQNVALTTSANSLEVGDTLQLTLKVIYNTGTEEFIVSDLFWSNLNPAIATIDGAGLLTAESPGISTIFAIKDDHVTTFQFTVLAATTTTSSATP